MTKKKPEEVRRKEILDAALQCFSTKGYHDTRVDDVVRESGLTKGAIYWYYKGKRELFVALIEQHLQEDKVLWKELFDQYELGPDLLITAGLLYLKRHLGDRLLSPFCAEFMAESYRDEVIRKKIHELNNEWRSMIKEAFDRAIGEGKMKGFDTESLASTLIAIIGGLMNQYWIGGREMDYETVWIRFCHALLDGIQKEANNT
jgi:AcrR family transcriptional regulator